MTDQASLKTKLKPDSGKESNEIKQGINRRLTARSTNRDSFPLNQCINHCSHGLRLITNDRISQCEVIFDSTVQESRSPHELNF